MDKNTLWNTTTKMITVYYKTDLNKDGTVNRHSQQQQKTFGSHGPEIPNPRDHRKSP
jgi:hypothetical protein